MGGIFAIFVEKASAAVPILPDIEIVVLAHGGFLDARGSVL
jgi:hypothetical protein